MPTTPMPPQLEAEINALWQEIAWLHMKWAEYDALYGRDAERIELLNSVADQFFGVVEMVLWGDLLLHISRLTGSPRSAGKHSLTVRRLPQLVDSVAAAAVGQAVQEAVDSAAFAKPARDKLYAHTDLAIATGAAAATFDLGSRTQMREALGKLVAAIDSVTLRYSESTNGFDFSHGFGTAEDVVKALQANDAAQRHRAPE